MVWYDGKSNAPVIWPQLAITTTSLPPATQGTPYSAIITATNGALPLIWHINNDALHNQWTITNTGSQTALLSGTPTHPGADVVTIRLDDQGGQEVFAAIPLTINASSASLAITTASLPTAQVGINYNTIAPLMTATGGTPPYSWSIDSWTPQKHLWGFITQPGQPYGFPQYDNGGQEFQPDVVVIRVTDSTGASVAQSYQIQLATSGAIAINTAATLPNATQNGGYAYQLLAQGGAPPYTWSITAHTGSNSWFIEETGWLYGVPTATTADTVTAKVTDCENNSVSATFSITTNTSLALANVDLINNAINLPNARAGHKYKHQFHAANGGTGAGQVYSIVSGTLPAGLTMTSAGLITGTPTATGNASCSLKVVDSGSNTAIVPIMLNVGPQSVGTQAINNIGTGFFVDTTGQLCDPNGFRFSAVGCNQNHPLNTVSGWNTAGFNVCRYGLFRTQFRGTNPAGSFTFAQYATDCKTAHTNQGRFVIFTQFDVPGTSTSLSGDQTATDIGLCAAYMADNYAGWKTTLEGRAGINIANEWGPPVDFVAAGVSTWSNAYAVAWDGPFQSGQWQMAVSNVNTTSGVITLSTLNAVHPLASAAAIGYIYFAGAGINKAVSISTTTGGSSGAWTVTATNPADVAGWTVGGFVSGGAIGIIRAAGYVNDPIYVDAGAVGQSMGDIQSFGTTVAQSDPVQNTVISYHGYGATLQTYGRISAVTKASLAVVTLNSTGSVHPLLGALGHQPASVNIQGVQGMTQLVGDFPVVVVSASAPWTVTLNVNSSAFGTYTGGGSMVASGGPGYRHIDTGSKLLGSLQSSGVGMQFGECGPSNLGGPSPTPLSYGEIVWATQANNLPLQYWAMDDSSPLGIVNGNPSQYFFGVTGAGNTNSYTVPTNLGPNGIDVVLNPRYGAHCLATPAPVFL